MLGLLLILLQPKQIHGLYQAFYPTQDSTIFLNEGEQAAGDGDTVIGCDGQGRCARKLTQFDVSLLPTDANITQVLLSLPTNERLGGQGMPFTIDMHQVTSPWTSDDQTVMNSETLVGNQALDKSVTWTHSSYDSVLWATPGGDVDTSVVSSVQFTGERSPLFIPTTPAFQTLVQQWATGETPNYGLLLKLDNEVSSTANYQFFRHQGSGNPAERSPRLLVVYDSVSTEQMPSPPSGPGIVLPGEPTQAPTAPTTASPVIQPSCPSVSAPGEILVTPPGKQTATIFQDEGEISASKGKFMTGESNGQPFTGLRRGLIQFDIASVVPAPANGNQYQVTCVEMILETTGQCTPCHGQVDVKVYPVTSSWSSSGINALDGDLNGIVANQGDVTWTYTSFPSDRWTTPGGDYEITLLLSEENHDLRREAHIFQTTTTFESVVQDMLNGVRANYGFLLRTDEAKLNVDGTGYLQFEGFDAEDPNLQPKLAIHYQIVVVDDKGGTGTPSSTVQGTTGIAMATLFAVSYILIY